jgi:uncharacterized protein YukE
MSGGMEMDPEAIQAFAAVLADAKAQFDKVKARVEQPNAVAEDFGRSWQDQGAQYAESWGMLGPDLASLSTLLEQVQTQLGQGAELTVAGDTASMDGFNQIGEADAPASTPAATGGSPTQFVLSNAWDMFKSPEVDTELSASFADVICGPRLDEAVKHHANGYLKRLEFGDGYPENRATDERARLLDLNWGKIEHDAVMLEGLGLAVRDLAATFADGTARLGETWKGDSYEAFKVAMGKICTIMNAYADGAVITGTSLMEAMRQTREQYQTYAQDSVDIHLNFGDVSRWKQWHKTVDNGGISTPEFPGGSQYNGFALSEACIMGAPHFCTKDNDDQRNILTDNFVTEYQWGIVALEPCYGSADRVATMYSDLVSKCEAARNGIKRKLDEFFGATDTTVNTVTGLMDIAVGNLKELAEEEAFTSLRVIGGGGGGAATVDAGGYPGEGGGGYPGGGSGGGAAPMPAVDVPEVAVPEVEPAVPDPAATDPAVAEPAVPETGQETVRIQDGDRAISVSSPDGSGQVRVTVEDATGATKSYSLDFDAASGLLPMGQAPAAAPEPAVGPDGQPVENEVQQIPASTNGKCVIEDGPLTITAERPLFAPDSLRLVVDDGTGEPTTYTVDFSEQTDDPTGTAAGLPAVAPGPAPAADQEIPQPAAEEVEPEVPAEQEPAAAAEPEALVAEPPAEAAVPEQPAAPTVDADQVTAPQAESDGTGAMSGRLPEPGAAELGVATDDSGGDAPAGAAAGMPMLGGAGAQGDSNDSGGRISSGWSVHGDLFDSGEPVYSMHGVLGDDDRDAEQVGR